MLTIGDRHADQVITIIKPCSINAGAAHVGKILQTRLFDHTVGRGHEDVMLVIKIFDGQHNRNAFTFRQRNRVNDRPSFGGS